jgi:hypothetical protein
VYFSVQLYFNPQFSLFKFSSLFISEALEEAFFSKKTKKGSYEKQVDDPGGPVSRAARKNKKQCLVQKKRKRRRTESGTLCVEGGTKDDCAIRRW